MGRRAIFLGLLVGLLLLGALAAPALLRAVPPRYLARLPQPLQAYGPPEQTVALLPTVAATADLSHLLDPTETATATAVAIPPTFTPPLLHNQPTPEASPTLPPTFTPPPPTPTLVPLPRTVRLEGITHQFQEWNNCGPATLAMTLSYFGIRARQSDTAAFLKPNPEDRNVTPEEMVDYVLSETDILALNRVNGDIYTLRRLLAAGLPVILEIGIEPPGEFRWLGWYGHYMLLVAYDDDRQQFWVYDSWLGTSEEPLQNAHPDGRVLPYSDVAEFWPQFNRNYIVLYRPEEAGIVSEIVGENLDDGLMWQNALETIRRETAAAPDNAFNWFNLGTTYNALGQYEQAAAAFDQARAIGLPWRMLWYQFGPYEAYYQVGRYDDVLLLANTTLENRPYFEESYYYRGLAQAALGNAAAARDDFRRAAAFNPRYAPAVEALAQLENGGS